MIVRSLCSLEEGIFSIHVLFNLCNIAPCIKIYNKYKKNQSPDSGKGADA